MTNEHTPNSTERPNALSRRGFLRNSLFTAGGAVLGSSLINACTIDDNGAGSDRVVVADWGGAIQDAEVKHLFRPFTKETGIDVTISGPPSDAKIMAMVQSENVEWDLVAGSVSNVLALGEEYFEKLPESVRTVPGVDPSFVHEYGVAYYVFSTNIGWNTDVLGKQRMESWADFWDTDKFPGSRTLQGGEGGSNPPLEMALLADGIAIDDLYPLDIDRAFSKLDEIKSSVPQWWSSGAQPGQMLVSEQVSAGAIWSGRVFTLQDENAPIDFTWNQGIYEPTAWIVPKGAPNKEAAFKLAEYSVQPEVQARLWGNYPCGPTNTRAYDKMPDKYARRLPTHPDNAGRQFTRDAEWWGDNRDEVLDRWGSFAIS